MSADKITLDDAAARLLQGKAVYIDVRSPEEFAAGHPLGAWNVPIMLRGGRALNEDFVACVRAVVAEGGQPSTDIIVGCQVGGRSRTACQLLAAEGVANVFDFSAGWAGRKHPFGGPGVPGWAGSGNPTATEAEPGRDWPSIQARFAG